MNARQRQIDPTVMQQHADLYSSFCTLFLKSSTELSELNFGFAKAALALVQLQAKEASEVATGIPVKSTLGLERPFSEVLEWVQQANEVQANAQKELWQLINSTWALQKHLISQAAAGVEVR